jgi:hypothetical protein
MAAKNRIADSNINLFMLSPEILGISLEGLPHHHPCELRYHREDVPVNRLIFMRLDYYMSRWPRQSSAVHFSNCHKLCNPSQALTSPLPRGKTSTVNGPPKTRIKPVSPKAFIRMHVFAF